MAALRFPNETDESRAARSELLLAERELREHVARVAARRRTLPMGGAVPEDYEFTELGPDGSPAARRMSELLPDGVDTLILYSFMYGPEMELPCPMCSSVIDGLDASAATIATRATLAIVAKSPVERIHRFARERGWTRARLLSYEGTRYGLDYHGEDEAGEQNAELNVFARRAGALHHFWASSGGVDAIWPLWNLLDLTPEGRGDDWYPGLDTTPLNLQGVLDIVQPRR